MNSIGSIICAYRKHRNLSQKELAAALNQSGLAATNQVISKWENDTAKPSIEVLFGICQILGIRNFYEEMYGADPLDKLSELNEAGKEKALDYIQLLIDSGKYKKQPEVQILTFPHRQIKLYDLPVSAGTGEFLDSEHYTLLDAETTIPEGTDFAVRIHGDSMEPMFANQQIIWIHQTGTTGRRRYWNLLSGWKCLL